MSSKKPKKKKAAPKPAPAPEPEVEVPILAPMMPLAQPSYSMTAVSSASEKLSDNTGLEELIRAALAELAPVIKDHSG